MRMEKFHHIWRQTLHAFLVTLMGLLLTIMMVQVLMRYGFNNSLIWAEEVCRYLLIWLSMLALLFAYERGEIASVRMALYALPRRLGYFAIILANLLAAIFCFVMVYYGYKYAVLAGSQPIPAIQFIFSDLFGDNTLNVPTVFWVYAVLPVGMAMLGIKIALESVFYVGASLGEKTLEQLHLDERGDEL